jgi:hypothetical protein
MNLDEGKLEPLVHFLEISEQTLSMYICRLKQSRVEGFVPTNSLAGPRR